VPRPYDVLVEPIKNSELISQGFLLPTKVYAPSEPNIEGVKVVKRGEYNQNQLGRAVSECTVFADVYSEWDRHAGGRATVAFVPGIPFGRDLARQFNFILGAGSAYLIEAKTKHAEREEIFRRSFKEKQGYSFRVTYFKEGFDLPCLSCSN
jgi:DNA repair protein RadD